MATWLEGMIFDVSGKKPEEKTGGTEVVFQQSVILDPVKMKDTPLGVGLQWLAEQLAKKQAAGGFAPDEVAFQGITFTMARYGGKTD